jgi:hypothetical protein
MEYKFVSPDTCSFITGIINTPIILIIYIIVSFIPCRNEFLSGAKGYFDDIRLLFKIFEIREYFIIIIYCFLLGGYSVLIYMTINDFFFYHIVIPYQFDVFINHILEYLDSEIDIYQLIIILIFFFIDFLFVIQLHYEISALASGVDASDDEHGLFRC